MQPLSDESDNDIDNHSNEALAGITRGILRTGLRTVGKTSLGSIPRPHPKVIAKTADTFSDIFEFHSSIKKASTDHSHNNNSNSPTGSGSRINKYRKYISIFAKSSVSFLQSSILGSTLFYIYDYCYPQFSLHIQYEPLPAFISGGIAGASHGFCFCSFENISFLLKNQYSQFMNKPPLVSHNVFPGCKYFTGTMISHLCVHSVLFGSYEGSKYLTSKLGYEASFVNERKIYIDILSICTCGTIAGISSEYISHYTDSFERVNIWKMSLKEIASLLKELRVTEGPTFRYLLTSAVPSAIGFLAYEVSKLVADKDYD